MTAVLDRTLTPCSSVPNGLGCPRRSPDATTTTTTAPRASADVCPMTNGETCPVDQAEIDKCGEC